VGVVETASAEDLKAVISMMKKGNRQNINISIKPE